jgi:carnitine O-acetyltransferase
MSQYNSQFGTCRVPGSPKDVIVSSSDAKHIVVMLKNQMYRLDVVLKDGGRVSIKELERQLFAIGQDCLSSSKEINIGLLTAGGRQNWADAYGIMKKDEKNAQNFKTIHDSILVLCLDDSSSGTKLDKTHLQFYHNATGENRWYLITHDNEFKV